MIILVLGDSAFRKEKITETYAQMQSSEQVFLDDTMATIADMEQYLYPSLFTLDAPLVHAKYVLSMGADGVQTDFIKKLAASPTVFLFEELALPATLLTIAKKHGVVHAPAKEVKTAKSAKGDIFAVTNALTAKDKKSRWLAFHASLAEHPIEAIMGILYWKVRDMALRGNADAWQLYHNLMHAHAQSFQKGIPLALAVEKVILG